MIPDLAVIIECYIAFRMIEILLMPSSRYTNQSCAAVAKVLAIVALAVSGFVCFDILMSATNVPKLP